MVGGHGWTERYRERWKWDNITWGSHAVDCYPGGCPLRIYVRDGKIVREEQSATLPVVQAGVLINTSDASAKGIANGEMVELQSDVGALEVAAKLSPSGQARPR